MSEDKIIVQLPMTSSTDFDVLLYFEESLSRMLSQNLSALVGGHQIVDDKFNILVMPKKDFEEVIGQVLMVIEAREDLGGVLIARQPKSGGRAVVVWPAGAEGDLLA